MGIFRRIVNFLRGKTNAALDRLEKPEEQLSVFVEELNESVLKLHKAVAGAVADEKKLRLQLDEGVRVAEEWERKAVMALESGDEPLAKEALLKQEDCNTRTQQLNQAWETQKKATTQLKESLSTAKHKVEDAKRQYTLLLARYRTVETKQKITQTLSSGFDHSPLQYIDKLNDKILKLEAETEANMELIGGVDPVDTENRFIALERQARGSKALDDLKAKVASRKQISGEKSSPESIQELKRKLG